jgi:hypothetical protein
LGRGVILQQQQASLSPRHLKECVMSRSIVIVVFVAMCWGQGLPLLAQALI